MRRTLLVLGFAALVLAPLAASVSPATAAPKAGLEGDLPPDLRNRIAKAVGDVDAPTPNRFAARRRALDAAESAIAVLRSEGYYGYEIEAEVSDTDPPDPIVRITPGPRFVFADPKVGWVGPAPSSEAQDAGVEAIGISPGAPGLAVEVLAAEGRALAAVRQQGYADAEAMPREVIVDHADHTVRPTFRISAGDLVRLDGLRLVTQGRTDSQWLQRLAPWSPGAPYDPDDVAELERRLLETGVYESATVALAPRKPGEDAQALRPVIVSLADRNRRSLELGASYSTSEGYGLDARWTRYNWIGRADTLTLIARLSDVDSRLSGGLTFPHWRRAQQKLNLGAQAYRRRTDAYDETGLGVSFDVQRRFRKTSFITAGGAIDASRTEAVEARTLSSRGRDLVIPAVFAAVSLDRSDDLLDPRRGWRLDARVEPTLLLGNGADGYVKTQAQASAYVPLGRGAKSVLAGRLKAGVLLAAAADEAPASRRFYSGGGGSVRGYAYQAVGPRLSDNTPAGGVSVIEASLELRQKLSGPWSVVGFVDVGAVGEGPTPSGEDFSAGAGLGVRYDLGFGPIRVDLAAPLDRRKGDAPVQIYLSIGQSF